jgi:hypothetical protein
MKFKELKNVLADEITGISLSKEDGFVTEYELNKLTPEEKLINAINETIYPELDEGKVVAVFIGAHGFVVQLVWTRALVEACNKIGTPIIRLR